MPFTVAVEATHHKHFQTFIFSQFLTSSTQIYVSPFSSYLVGVNKFAWDLNRIGEKMWFSISDINYNIYNNKKKDLLLDDNNFRYGISEFSIKWINKIVSDKTNIYSSILHLSLTLTIKKIWKHQYFFAFRIFFSFFCNKNWIHIL